MIGNNRQTLELVPLQRICGYRGVAPRTRPAPGGAQMQMQPQGQQAACMMNQAAPQQPGRAVRAAATVTEAGRRPAASNNDAPEVNYDLTDYDFDV